MRRLEGQVAIVTGAASGIGFASARLLAEEGAHVVAADLNAEALDAALPGLSEGGLSVSTVTLDVADSAAVAAFFAAHAAGAGRIDVLVNCAGIAGRASIVDCTDELWDRVMNVNLKSVFLMCRGAVPVMLDQGAGRIINMGSGAGIVGVKEQAAYCASKGGVVLLTKQLMADYQFRGIRANAVCPTTVLTPFVQNRLDRTPDPAAALRELEAEIGPVLSVDEVAAVIRFLATEGLKNMPVPYIQ